MDKASNSTNVPSNSMAAGEAMRENRITSPKLHEALSFVDLKTPKGGGYDYWANVPAGSSYTEDCAIGREKAEEFIAFSGKYPTYGNSTLLGAIALAMEANGATHGHKIGFMNTINKYAMVGAYVDAKGGKLLIEPKARLEALTTEIAKIIASNPDMMIDYITVYKHGVYSSLSFQDDDLSAGVKAALEDYNAKEAIYRPLADELGDTDLCQAEWEAKEAAEEALLRAPCITIADVHAKAKLALEDESVFDSITNCTHADGRHIGKTFLRSLLGESPL